MGLINWVNTRPLACLAPSAREARFYGEFLVNIALHHTFVSWVKHPQFLDLMYTTRLVSVMVDPTSLPPGVHSAYVKGYDTACPDKGAIFEIPIHVVVPGRMVSKVSKCDLKSRNLLSR